MKKALLLSLVLFAIGIFAGGQIQAAEYYPLLAGQDIEVGYVQVENDGTNLTVKYVLTDLDWVITCTNLYVGKNAPPTSSPGQFPYDDGDAVYSCGDTIVEYIIPLADIDSYSMQLNKQGKATGVMVADGDPGVDACSEDDIYIATHAKVVCASGNILSNPDAETGDMTGWTYNSLVRAIDERLESTGTVLPRSGEYFFDMTAIAGSYGEMYQEVDVTGWDGASFKAGGWVQTELWPVEATTFDYGVMVVEFYDASSASLGSISNGPLENPVAGQGYDGYTSFGVEGIIPEGAVSAIYELRGHLVQGTYVNVFYDDLAFEIEKEETAWGEGSLIGDSGNWSMYITYEVECPCVSANLYLYSGPTGGTSTIVGSVCASATVGGTLTAIVTVDSGPALTNWDIRGWIQGIGNLSPHSEVLSTVGGVTTATVQWTGLSFGSAVEIRIQVQTGDYPLGSTEPNYQTPLFWIPVD
jgi:hypothetical protein